MSLLSLPEPPLCIGPPEPSFPQRSRQFICVLTVPPQARRLSWGLRHSTGHDTRHYKSNPRVLRVLAKLQLCALHVPMSPTHTVCIQAQRPQDVPVGS